MPIAHIARRRLLLSRNDLAVDPLARPATTKPTPTTTVSCPSSIAQKVTTSTTDSLTMKVLGRKGEKFSTT
jgi:hypothetical protein